MTDNINGANIVAHDARTRTTYVLLPPSLRRPIDGGCRCPFCKQNPDLTPSWDTLAVPFTGHAWTVHMPDPAEFRDYLARNQNQ